MGLKEDNERHACQNNSNPLDLTKKKKKRIDLQNLYMGASKKISYIL